MSDRTDIDSTLQKVADEMLSNGITLTQMVKAIEERYVRTALRRARGNVRRAAQMLGVHRNTLHNKLEPKRPHLARMAKRGPRSRWNR